MIGLSDKILTRRILLAFASSLYWFATNLLADRVPLPGTLSELLIWSTGAVYTACVLLPYLDRTIQFWPRTAGLLALGGLCYWGGVQVAIEIEPDAIHVAFVGVITAVFIALTAWTLTSFRPTARLWIMLAFAGASGGGMIGFGVQHEIQFFHDVGHATWQILVCIALYCGRVQHAQHRSIR